MRWGERNCLFFMIESSYDITKFLPISIQSNDILDYIKYHSENLDKSLENKIESAIFFHVHILYMIFIYYHILRISQEKPKEFSYSWILSSSQEKEFLKNPSSPFSFSPVNEKSVFKFFRLLDFDEGFISNISACIKDRNDMSHATGTLMQDLDKKIATYIFSMEKIVEKSQDFFAAMHMQFMSDNEWLFQPGYSISRDDVEINFLYPYLISRYEIETVFLPKEGNDELKKIFRWFC